MVFQFDQPVDVGARTLTEVGRELPECRQRPCIDIAPIALRKEKHEKPAAAGIEGLRVIDGSVTPTRIGGNTNAAVIMIAERAAGLIRRGGRPVLNVVTDAPAQSVPAGVR
ncbi:hypothetical protein MAFF211271_30820 [Ralstonia syzygii subsp. indonesiensis]|nr:hypothetical protein MAFF211271_30820 [Ralstonia pseudosolanacearum]